jgi:hypothetical protein
MSDPDDPLLSKVASLGRRNQHRTAAKREENRAKWPEFAEFVDEFRRVFGTPAGIKFPDGTQWGKIPTGTWVQFSDPPFKLLKLVKK